MAVTHVDHDHRQIRVDVSQLAYAPREGERRVTSVDHERDLQFLCQLCDREHALIVRAVSLFQRMELNSLEVMVFHRVF